MKDELPKELLEDFPIAFHGPIVPFAFNERNDALADGFKVHGHGMMQIVGPRQKGPGGFDATGAGPL